MNAYKSNKATQGQNKEKIDQLSLFADKREFIKLQTAFAAETHQAEHGEVTDVHRRDTNANCFEERAGRYLESIKTFIKKKTSV
jgi:hypothetical protein